MISSVLSVCVCIDANTALACGWGASGGHGAGERQGKHQEQGSGFPLRFTFSSTLLHWRKKKILRGKKICKTLLMYIFSSSGLESLEESLLQDQGTGCISRDICTWKQAIFISSRDGPPGRYRSKFRGG